MRFSDLHILISGYFQSSGYFLFFQLFIVVAIAFYGSMVIRGRTRQSKTDLVKQYGGRTAK